MTGRKYQNVVFYYWSKGTTVGDRVFVKEVSFKNTTVRKPNYSVYNYTHYTTLRLKLHHNQETLFLSVYTHDTNLIYASQEGPSRGDTC